MRRTAVFLACLLAVASAYGASARRRTDFDPLRGRATLPLSAGQTHYVPCEGALNSATRSRVETQFARTTHLRKIRCTVDAAPGGSATITGTVQVGTCGSPGDTDLVCTIQGAATSNEDTGSAKVSVGECCVVKYVYSAGVETASRPSHSIISR